MQTRNEIKKGSIVLYNGGNYRVSRATKNTVNLTGVWGGRIQHKSVPIGQVQENESAWYEAWSRSESYQCM